MNLVLPVILAVIFVTDVYARDEKIIEYHVKQKCEMDSPVKLSYFKVDDKVNIWCCDCPAGHFMDAVCNNTNKPFPICKQCEYSDNKQTFMDEINHSHDCYVSRKSCDDVMNTWLKNGNSKEDNTCECNDGYYRETDEGHCKKHTSCSKGFGVTKLGTKSSDTGCVKCVGNKFSDIESSTEECKPHSKCKSGQKLVFGGNSSSDVTCLDVVLPSLDSNSLTPTESITTAVEDQVATEISAIPVTVTKDSSPSIGVIVAIVLVLVFLIIILAFVYGIRRWYTNKEATIALAQNGSVEAQSFLLRSSDFGRGNSRREDGVSEEVEGQHTDDFREGPSTPTILETEMTNGEHDGDVDLEDSSLSEVRSMNGLVEDDQGDPGVVNETEREITDDHSENEVRDENARENDMRLNNPLLSHNHEGGNSQRDNAGVFEDINHIAEGLSTIELGNDVDLPNESEDADSSEGQLTNSVVEEEEVTFREDHSADNKAEREIAGDHSENDGRGNDMRLNNPELFPEDLHKEISAYDQGRVDEVLHSHETGEAMLCGEHGLCNEMLTEDLKKFIRDKKLLRHLQIEDLEQENKYQREMRSKMMICVAQKLGIKLTPKYLFELAVKYETQEIYKIMYGVFKSALNQQPH